MRADHLARFPSRDLYNLVERVGGIDDEREPGESLERATAPTFVGESARDLAGVQALTQQHFDIRQQEFRRRRFEKVTVGALFQSARPLLTSDEGGRKEQDQRRGSLRRERRIGLDLAERFEPAPVREVGAQQYELRRRSGRQPQRLGAGPGFDDSETDLTQYTAFSVESDFAAIHVKDSDPGIIHGFLFLPTMRGVTLRGAD